MMLTSMPTHIAFADETHYSSGRYRGLGVVSFPYSVYTDAQAMLKRLLQESNVSEIKWKYLTSARMRFAANKFIEWALVEADKGSLRVDVLTWDIEDSRHKIRHRDDLANMQRMYYQLFKNVLSERWPDETTWWLLPDEHTAMKWNEIEGFLEQRSERIDIKHDLFSQGRTYLDLRNRFKIYKLEQAHSNEEPFIQMADLFAGLAVYSRTSYSRYAQWQAESNSQQRLFPLECHHNLSNSDIERCQVLHNFNGLCKKKKLGVSLVSSQGLRTYNPSKPINFWWYLPQHSEDIAPQKAQV